MPGTPYKRVQVVTIPPVYDCLQRISAATGDPMGRVVRQMLEESLPALRGMAEALEAVPRSPGEALARMSKTLDSAMADARQLGLALDEKQRTLVQQATRHARKQAKQAREAARK